MYILIGKRNLITHTHTHTRTLALFIYVPCSCLVSITSDRKEIWAQDLYPFTALVEAAKSLAPSNLIGHGKVLY